MRIKLPPALSLGARSLVRFTLTVIGDVEASCPAPLWRAGKQRPRRRLWPTFALALFSVLNLQSLTAFAQGTTLSYRGRLNDGGTPANGRYDLRFAIYDALSGGTQQGVALTNSAVTVTNGQFAVTLDFGAGAFPGADRWLETGVVTNGGGAFVTLAPRQKITATPYAITAISAGNVTGTIALAQLPAAVVTNSSSGVSLNGYFAGDGGGLTNLNAASAATFTTEVNAKSPPYSAVGDGVANDTLALNRCLTNRHVYLPPGTYLVDGLVCSNNLHLRGAGALAVLKRRVPDLGYVLDAGTYCLQLDSVAIDGSVSGQKNISLSQTNTGFPNEFPWSSGVKLQNNGPASVRNCLIYNCGQVGVLIGGDSVMTYRTNYVHIEGTVFTNNYRALQLGYSSASDYSLVVGNTLAHNYIALSLDSGNHNVTSCEIHDNYIGVASAPSDARFHGVIGSLTINHSGLASFYLDACRTRCNIGPCAISGGGDIYLVGGTSGQIFHDVYGNIANIITTPSTTNHFRNCSFFMCPTVSGGGLLETWNVVDDLGTLCFGQGLAPGPVLVGNAGGLTNLSAASLASGSVADARLSANVALLNGNQTFTGTKTFNNANNQFIGGFTGDGGGLTNVGAAELPPYVVTNGQSGVTLTGTFNGNGAGLTNVGAGDLPPYVVTNGQSGVTLTGTFGGNGAGLAALNADNLASGSVADSRLSANVATLSGSQTFGGDKAFTSAANVFNGNGAGLTALNAGSLASGTVADARLSANVALLNGANVFSGSNRFAGAVTATNANNQFVGKFTGDGAGLTNVGTGSLPSYVVTNGESGVTLSGTFSGNGAGLTSLNASNLASGTVADARLSANVALRLATNTFSGNQYFTNGNIGIGTTNPTNRLEVAGTVKIGASGTAIQSVSSASALLDFPNTGTGSFNDLTITVSGASDGDVVALGVPNANVVAGTSYSAWVSAANTVTVRFTNNSGSNSNPAVGTFRICVIKF